MKLSMLIVLKSIMLCISLISIAYSAERNNDVDNYNYQGISHFKNGQVDLALKSFNMAIQKYPEYGMSYVNRGRVYEAMKQYDLAIKDYSKMIELNPSNAQAYYNRGNIYRKTSNNDMAMKDFTTAIRKKPNYVKALGNRGILYWLGYKDREKACSDLTKACSLGKCNSYNYFKNKRICR